MRQKIFLVFLLIILCTVHYAEGQIYISSGISINSASVKVINLNTDMLEKYRASKLAPDFINIMFAIKVSNQFCIKSGFYTHPEYFKYTAYHNFYTGNPKIVFHTEEVMSRNFDFPLLISFSDKADRINISAGPYIGIALFTFDTGKLKEIDYGIDLSLSVGSEKWKFTCYSLVGCTNLVKSSLSNEPAESREKARASTFGLNITRVLHLKKSVTP